MRLLQSRHATKRPPVCGICTSTIVNHATLAVFLSRLLFFYRKMFVSIQEMLTFAHHLKQTDDKTKLATGGAKPY